MSEMGKALKRGGGGLWLLGLFFVFAGVLACLSPLASGIAATVLLGAFLAAAGVVQMLFGVKERAWGLGGLLGGLLLLVVGGLVVADPLLSLGLLTIVLAALFFANGLLRVAAAIDLPSGTKGRGFLLIGGVLSVVLGIMLIRQWPLSGAWAVGLLVGIELVFQGLAMMGVGGTARGIGKAMDQAAEA